MATLPPTPDRLAFGPFEVDTAAGELLNRGIRVRLPGQSLQILLLLLARPGEVVSRDHLREHIWGEGTFVDFEHGLNAAMNKLRRALGDSAEDPRYIETIPGRGYRFIRSLDHPQPAPLSVSAATVADKTETLPRRRTVQWAWWLASLAVALAIAFAIGRRSHELPSTPPLWKLNQLTADSGYSGTPAISPDGKLVTFSSDRVQEGALDLYVQQTAGGQPIRLTFDGAGNTTPDFSPDGSKIVFRSSQDGGGIYLIPTLGGEARLLARDAFNPKFSPDGSRVAYWVGSANIAVTVPFSGSVWVVPVAGGEPRRVGANFTVARFPVWAPDGKHLLLVGYTASVAFDRSALDWWLVDIESGQTVRTGVNDALIHAGLQGIGVAPLASAKSVPAMTVPRPACWIASPDTVIFSAQSGDTQNLWETGISLATGKVNGTFKRLTAGSANETVSSCASHDAISFTSNDSTRDVWVQPFDLDRAKPTAELQQLAAGLVEREDPSLSNNGRYIAFASNQSGTLSIWLRELATGKEIHVADSSFLQRNPLLNPSGTEVAFSSFENDRRFIYLYSPDRAPEKLCEGCLRTTGWSVDGKSIVIYGGAPFEVDLVDVSTHQQAPLVKHPTDNIMYGRFSPDGRWITFTHRTQPNHARIMIAPADGPKPVPQSAWIKIAEEGPEDWAEWSPDGKTLYFTSPRDGHTCLWAQRLNPTSHQPTGAAFPVEHFHGHLTYQQRGWSAAGGRIAIVLVQAKANIWMMSRPNTTPGASLDSTR